MITGGSIKNDPSTLLSDFGLYPCSEGFIYFLPATLRLVQRSPNLRHMEALRAEDSNSVIKNGKIWEGWITFCFFPVSVPSLTCADDVC